MTSEKNQQTYNCELCSDTGYIPTKTDRGNSAVAPCRCLMRAAKRRLFGEYFEFKTLANYEGRNASMSQALALLKKNVAGSFYIYGNIGLGKTHLLAGLYEANYETGRWQSTTVLTETQLVESIKDESIREKLQTAVTFIVDDIGKIKIAPWEIEALFNFYNDVYRNGQALVISSNYTLSELGGTADRQGIYGGAITRRIEERCEILQIKQEVKQ